MLYKINALLILNKLAILTTTLLTLLIFATWDGFLISNFNKNFIGLVFPDNLDISNFVTWMQLNYRILDGDYFLTRENFLSFNSGTIGIPFFSLWINSALIKIVGLNSTILIFSILIPSFCFLFTLLIYLRYLPLLWSIFLSFLGLLSISDSPFRSFLISILDGNFDLSSNRPDIMGMPFPSLSLLAFLVTLFLTIQRTYPSKRRTLILTILWGLQTQFHILNAILGIPFWIITLLIICKRQFKEILNYKAIKYLFIRFLLLSLVCLPFLIMIFVTKSNWHYFINGQSNFDFFNITVYFVLPLTLLYLSYLVFRVDPYEIFIKFTPIWSMMAVELIITLLWYFFRLGISSEIIVGRLGLFFLHLFYFIPVIYCMHKGNIIRFYEGVEAKKLSRYIRSLLFFVFKKFSVIYLPLLTGLLLFYVSYSGYIAQSEFNQTVKKQYLHSMNIKKYIDNNLDNRELLIGNNNIINLYIMTKYPKQSLWTNSFTSTKTIDYSIKRFVIFAKIAGWTEIDFLKFMSSENIDRFNIKKNILNNKVIPGLGYWLLFNKPRFSGGKLKIINKKILLEYYQKVDLGIELNKYKINNIFIYKINNKKVNFNIFNLQ